MKQTLKWLPYYSMASLALSPVIGWGMAQTGLPSIVAVYIMVAIFMWPLFLLLFKVSQEQPK